MCWLTWSKPLSEHKGTQDCCNGWGPSCGWDHKRNKTFTIICPSLLHPLVEPELATVTNCWKKRSSFITFRGKGLWGRGEAQLRTDSLTSQLDRSRLFQENWHVSVPSSYLNGFSCTHNSALAQHMWHSSPGCHNYGYVLLAWGGGFKNSLYFQVVTACEMAREGSILCRPHLLAEKPNQIITHGCLRHYKVKLRVPAEKL